MNLSNKKIDISPCQPLIYESCMYRILLMRRGDEWVTRLRAYTGSEGKPMGYYTNAAVPTETHDRVREEADRRHMRIGDVYKAAVDKLLDPPDPITDFLRRVLEADYVGALEGAEPGTAGGVVLPWAEFKQLPKDVRLPPPSLAFWLMKTFRPPFVVVYSLHPSTAS